jgi:hypothetical protein
MLVELDLFSGRPNPRWELDRQARHELKGLLDGLDPALGAFAEPPVLGYRGFRLLRGGSGPSRAYGGRVTTPEGALQDPARAIERFLLDRLPPRFGDLREIVAAELDPPAASG